MNVFKHFGCYYVLVGLFLLLFTGCPDYNAPGDTGQTENSGSSPGCTDFQENVLAELNFARTNPAGYAEARLKAYYNAGTDNGAYIDIKNRTAVGVLELQFQLCAAASKYAAYLAHKNVFGHYENGTPSERCLAEGYPYYSGENLAANSASLCNGDQYPRDAAVIFVAQLIIDQGIPGLGHRNAIMSGVHKKVGVGFFRDISSTYKNYTVHDFGSQ